MRFATALLGVKRRGLIPADPAIGAAYGGGFYCGKIVEDALLYWLIVADVSASRGGLAVGSSSPISTGSSAFNGRSNSLAISASSPAAAYCLSYEDGSGNSDYYLGALFENEIMYRNLKGSTNVNSVAGVTPTYSANPYSSPAGAAYTASAPPTTSVASFAPGGSQAFTTTNGTVLASSTFDSDGQNVFGQSVLNGNISITDAAITSKQVRPIRKILIPGQ